MNDKNRTKEKRRRDTQCECLVVCGRVEQGLMKREKGQLFQLLPKVQSSALPTASSCSPSARLLPWQHSRSLNCTLGEVGAEEVQCVRWCKDCYYPSMHLYYISQLFALSHGFTGRSARNMKNKSVNSKTDQHVERGVSQSQFSTVSHELIMWSRPLCVW